MQHSPAIIEHESNGMRFFAVRTGAKDVVSIEGSVHGGYYLFPQEQRMVQRVLVGILDAGTKRWPKDALRAELARRGATISFAAGADRTSFSATCLPTDVRFICDLIVECLTDALLKKSEFDYEVKRVRAELEEEKTETRTQAAQAFARLTFDNHHVNYAESFSQSLKGLETMRRSDLVSFQRLIGRGGLVFAIAGDIEPTVALETARRSFAKLSEGTSLVPPKPRNAKVPSANESRVSIKDKKNIDVFIGASVPITYNDPSYLPLVVLSQMLGGGGLFVSHLMRTIRDRDGYAYAIYARPTGFGDGADGALRIWATFSPAKFDEAVEATRNEIAIFFNSGLTADALSFVQDLLAGGYSVSLSTSRGIAAALHGIGREGKPLSYFYEYPSLIRAITLDDLHAAAAFIPLDKLSLAAAGTFMPNT